jgi:hypothetical protein
MTLNADQYMIAAGGGSMVSVLFDILLGFGVSLIILKILKKGFECTLCGRTATRMWSRPTLSSALFKPLP